MWLMMIKCYLGYNANGNLKYLLKEIVNEFRK